MLPLVVAFAVGAVAQGAVLGWRSVPLESGVTAGSDDDLVVLSFNTLDVVTPAELFDLVDAQDADVVVLPETSYRTGKKVAALMAQTGRPMRVYTADGSVPDVAGTTLLVGERLGAYGVAQELPTHFGSMRVDPVDPALPGDRRGAPDLPGRSLDDGRLARGHHAGRPRVRDARRARSSRATSTPPSTIPACATWVRASTRPGRSARRRTARGRRRHPACWRHRSTTCSSTDAPGGVVDFAVLPATGGSDHRPIVATLERR